MNLIDNVILFRSSNKLPELVANIPWMWRRWW